MLETPPVLKAGIAYIETGACFYVIQDGDAKQVTNKNIASSMV